jgi:hypothetical protein
VVFGELLSAAAKRLGGTIGTDEPRSDDRFLTFPGDTATSIAGSLRSEVVGGTRSLTRSGPTVGSFSSVSARIRYPRGTFVGESLARFKRVLGHGARPERREHNAAIGYYLVGPQGRTLWGYGTSQNGVLAIGLAESLTGARIDWSNEG